MHSNGNTETHMPIKPSQVPPDLRFPQHKKREIVTHILE